MAYLNEKFDEITEEKRKSDALKDQQETSMNELNAKLDKLRQIGAQYGLDIDTHTVQRNQLKQLQDKHDTLQKEKRVLKGAIDATSKKFEKEVGEKRKEYETLLYNKAKIVF